jgi:sugar transferase (PEP-CTERM system associated)
VQALKQSDEMKDFLPYSVPRASLLQIALELFWVFVAAIGAIVLLERWPIPRFPAEATPEIVYAILILVFNFAFGVYRRRESLARSTYFTRFWIASALATLVAYIIADALPGGAVFRQSIGVAALVAITGLLVLRHALVLPLISSLLPYRLLVLGTGPEARQVEASLAGEDTGLCLVGFYPFGKREESVVSPKRVLGNGESLAQAVKRLRVNEIVVAAREQRGGILPLRDLLACRLNGVKITELARFFERVHGHVPLDMSRASWFIYGAGYRKSWLRSVVKRLFDLTGVAILLLIAFPVMVISAVAIGAESGRPIIYRQKRVGHRGKHFTMLKFRSMTRDAEKGGTPAWATVNDARVTRVGRFMRQMRIDELPQLINVLRGEMSLVGPRPERPEFVAMLSEQIPFYSIRHSVKPGITGWAQVRYSYVATVEDTAKKLEYDIYYVKNHSLLLDILILLETVRVVLLGEGAR